MTDEEKRKRNRERCKRYYQRHREDLLAKHRESYQENREERCEKKRKFYAENRDAICDSRNKLYQKNRESICAKKREWVANHPEYKKNQALYHAKWQRDNSQHLKEYNLRRLYS